MNDTFILLTNQEKFILSSMGIVALHTFNFTDRLMGAVFSYIPGVMAVLAIFACRVL